MKAPSAWLRPSSATNFFAATKTNKSFWEGEHSLPCGAKVSRRVPCSLTAEAGGIKPGCLGPSAELPRHFFLQQLIENLTTAHPLRCRAEASFFSASCSGEFTSPSFFRTSGLIRIVEGNITALLMASTESRRVPQVRLLNLGLGGGFLSALSALLVRLNFLFVTIGVKIQTDLSRCPLGAAPYGSQGAGVDFPSARKWSFPLSIFQPCPPSSETCHRRSLTRTRFEDRQQPGHFQRLLQVRPEMTKLQASAFGFCLSMHFDECAEARAVHIIDLLQINDHTCGPGCQQIVDHCKQPAALFSQHQTPFERQKVDSIHLTLRYFQRHRWPPPGTIQDPLRAFANASIISSLLATRHSPLPHNRMRHLPFVNSA